MMRFSKPTGMKAFTIVWLGQLLSLTGSSMSFFALTIWAWEKTDQMTALGLVGFFRTRSASDIQSDCRCISGLLESKDFHDPQ